MNKFEVGESRLLKGAVFRLKSKTGSDYDVTVGEAVAASQFVFSNLTPGTYTLTETRAPSGYNTISPVDIQVYEENGVLKIRKLTDPTNTQTGAIELVNGNFTMNVVDEDFNTEFTKVNERGEPLENAVFELRQITASGYRRVLTGLTSNSQGKLRVDHLLAGMTYELWETRAPSGYSKLTTAAARFTVSDTGTIRFESGSARITNQVPAYKVKVQKVDAVTGRPVTIQTRIGIANSQGEIIERQVASFNNGEFLFTKRFAPGTYYIKEEGTPSGYIGLSGVVPFTIHADGTVEVSNSYLEGIDVTTSSPDTITIKVKNYPLGKFKVSKRVKGLNDLPNLITGQMTFTLTRNGDPSFVPIVKEQAANLDFSFENLQPGVYTLTETKAPTGYIKSTETYTIQVDRDGSVRFYSESDTTSHLASNMSVMKSSELIASPTYDTSTEDKTLDNSLTTGALYQLPSSTLTEGQWWGVDLGSIQRVTQVVFAQGKNETHGRDSDKMDRYMLEYSSDGITYQSIGEYTETEVTPSVDIYARYIRARNLQTVAGRWLGIRELQVSVRDATQMIVAGGSDEAANIIKIGNVENPEFKIEKVDSNNNQISKPVIFKLYKVDDSTTATSLASVTLDDSKFVQTLEFTGQSVLTRLTATVLGRYALVEVQAPEGYDGLTAPVLLELSETTKTDTLGRQKAVTRFSVLSQTNSVSVSELPDGSDTLANAISIKVKNTQRNYNFRVLKKDFNTNAGLDASFTLYHEDGRRINAGNTTTSGENLVFRNLNPGTYILRETTAPGNYNTIADIKLTISQTGQLTIVEGPTNLLTTSNADENRDIRLTVKNIPYLEMSVQKLKKSTAASMAGVRLKITAIDPTPAPNFRDVAWHQRHFAGVVNTTDKTVEWATRNDSDAVFLLPQGNYRLEEISAPAGYKRLTPFSFTITTSNQIELGADAPAGLVSTTTKDNRLSIVLKNEFEKKIKVKKVDKATQRLLSGAKFKLFAADQTSQIGDEKTSNNQGILEFTITESGTYYLQESQSPTGYVTNGKLYKLVIGEDGSVTTDNGDENFVIGTMDTSDSSTTITVKNENRNLKIKKRDYHNSAIGLDARFELFLADGRTSVTINGIPMRGNTSSSDNSITFSNLPVGIYILKEVTVPQGGYRPTSQLQDIKFEIQADGSLRILEADFDMVNVDISQGSTLEMTIKNFKQFRFRIQKTDSGNENQLLNGATFTIYSDKDNNGIEETEIVSGITTNGIFETSLSFGYYILQETAAPVGYQVNGTKYRFQINHNGTTALHNGDNMVTLSSRPDGTNTLLFNMKNTKQTTYFKLAKRAYSNSDRRLAAVFELKEEGDTATVVTKTTATDGEEIVFDNLRIGQIYQLKETQAPEGYQLNTKVYRLRLTDSGQVELLDGDDLLSLDDSNRQLLTAKNLKRGEYPKTGGFGVLPYITLGGGIMLLALAVELQKERRWKRIRK
ncbi:SpaA isopeptide-forming pilin-related protein [Streptococcus suis]|uniref:SpaA isopeptide-forming pilin-related protein n=1 Tax=Streptococcus suis TaxID=1307 RepID=UPI0038B7C3C0